MEEKHEADSVDGRKNSAGGVSYDSTADVLLHKDKVRNYLFDFIFELLERSDDHDNSKLEAPEKPIFDRYPAYESGPVEGEEYRAKLAEMGEGLKHHYATNRHHPEHFENGVSGMNLSDIVEMVCDWKATASAKRAPVNLDHLCGRFAIDDQLRAILENTLREMDVTE
jgi:hypothetical protein